MKQVNFKELNVEVGIDEFESRDLREGIGNALHRTSESIPMSDLARKIFYSEGVIEIDDQDFDTMMSLLKVSFKRFIVDSIEREANKAKEIEENKPKEVEE